jgi:hypothetical protein
MPCERIPGIVFVAALASSAMPSPAGADVELVSQRYDRQNGLLSQRETAPDGWSLTADDFRLARDAELTSLEATFIIDDRVEPVDWDLRFHEDRNGRPGDLIASFTDGEMRDTGEDFDPRHHPQWAVVEVMWDLDHLFLEEGRYWVIATGVGEERLFQRAWWGSANTDRPRNNEARFLSPYYLYPFWTRWSDVDRDLLLDRHIDFDDVPFDAAFTIRGDRAAATPDLRRLRAVKGEIVAGDADDLASSDGEELLGIATIVADGAAEFRLHALARLRGDVDSLTIVINSYISQNGGTGRLMLREIATGEWRTILSFPLDTEPRTVEIDGVRAADFVDDDGRLRLALRLINFDAGGLPFMAWIDEWSIEAR